ncbi:MAG: MFS transporter [Desulfobacterales bacterium]|nr:MFS transporter [Desulfobacterales bacterium]
MNRPAPSALSDTSRSRSRLASVPLRITIFVTGTLVFALLLNAALSVLTLEKIYSKSLLSEYSVIGRYYVRKIERSLKFGKTLPKFTGMPKLLNEFRTANPEISEIFICSEDRTPLFAFHALNLAQQDSLTLEKDIGEQETVRQVKDKYRLLFPLYGGGFRNKTFQGFLEIVLPETLIQDKIKAMIATSGKLLAVASGASAVIFFFVGLVVMPTKRKKSRIYGIPLKTRALLLTSLVLILSQIGFSYYNVQEFRDRYFGNIQDKCRTLGGLLQSDIQYLLNLGIPVNKLIKIDGLLKEVLDNIPALSDVTIVDANGGPLYRVASDVDVSRSRFQVHAPDPGNPDLDANRIVLPVAGRKTTEGYIHLNISDAVVAKTIRDLVMDSGTVAVVSLLIAFEFVFFLVAILATGDAPTVPMDQTIGHYKKKTNGTATVPVSSSVRTAAFLYAFAMALSMSFLPIYANSLFTGFFGLSREIAMGLPISAEMLAVAVSLVLGGYWLDRRGWLGPFLTGVLITGMGMVACGMAQSTMELILCRGLVGFGYGLALMSTQTVVISLSPIGQRSAAVAGLEAGFFSGFISSTAVGGMLAEKIGFRGVFFVGSVLIFISMIFVLIFLRKTGDAGKSEAPATAVSGQAGPGIFKLFTSVDFMGGLLLSAIPSSLCLVGFLYFASPLFLTDLGVGQGNIARLMMPYGLCMVYVAPMISRWVDRAANKRIPVVAGGILGGLALLSVYYLNSIPMFVLILVLFSISGGMSYGARISFISESPTVQAVGVGKSMGTFNSLERIGNINGPIIVGGMITAVGLTSAISSLGMIYLVGTLLFFLLSRRARSASMG